MSDRPSKGDQPENRKSERHEGGRVHHDAYTQKADHAHKMGSQPGDKHLHHVSIHDASGHHVERMHTVKKGETVWGIAKHELNRHGHHAENKEIGKYSHRIIRANHLHDPKHLKPGSELMMPEHKHYGKRDHNEHGKKDHNDHGKKDPHARLPEDKEHQDKNKHAGLPEDKKHHDKSKKHQSADGAPSGQEGGERPHRKSHEGGARRSAPSKSAPSESEAPQRRSRRAEAPRGRRSAAPSEDGGPVDAPSRQPAAPSADVPDDDARRQFAPAQPAPDDARRQFAPSQQPAEAPRPGGPVVTLPDGRQIQPDIDPNARPSTPIVRPNDARPDARPDVAEAPPTAQSGVLSGKTFVIDPGHGLNDPGTQNFGVNEKDLVLPYAALLGRKLQALGAHVVYTRPVDRDGFATYDQRTRTADQARPTAVIRLHANEDKTHQATGLETYWTKPADRPLAEALHSSELQAERGVLNDRGTRQRVFQVHPQAPSALIELGYMSNRQELSRLMDPAYRNRAVDGIVNGLVRYVQSGR